MLSILRNIHTNVRRSLVTWFNLSEDVADWVIAALLFLCAVLIIAGFTRKPSRGFPFKVTQSGGASVPVPQLNINTKSKPETLVNAYEAYIRSPAEAAPPSPWSNATAPVSLPTVLGELDPLPENTPLDPELFRHVPWLL